jgi:hypothetical protein
MGLFDWVEMGFVGQNVGSGGENAAAKAFEKLFKGSFSVTMGDALSSFVMGGRHTHIYGDEFKFVLDWESILEGLLGRIPGVGEVLFAGIGGALLNGAGGNTTMTYGHKVDLTYGEQINVKRAVSAQATGKNYLWNWFTHHETMFTPSVTAAGGGTVLQQKVDNICGVIGGILSALMVLSSLALELVAAIKYPTGDPMKGLRAELKKLADSGDGGGGRKPYVPPGPGSTTVGSTGGTDGGNGEKPNPWKELYEASEVPEGPARMQTLLRTLSWTISSRLAALIIQVELIGQASRDGARELWICQQLARAVAANRAWRQSISDTIRRAEAGERQAVQAVETWKAVAILIVFVLAAVIAVTATLVATKK